MQIKTKTLHPEEHLTRSTKTILVVGDDPELRLGLNIRLKANGYNIVFAVDGVSSIAAARNHGPDLILLDLGIPAGDGFSVLERLAASDTMSLIPVIVLSARDRHSNRDRALKAGACAFLQKPVDASNLLSTIRHILGEEPAATCTVYDLDRDASTRLIAVVFCAGVERSASLYRRLK